MHQKANTGSLLAMFHVATCILSMEDQTKRLGQIVAGVDNSRNMLHNTIFSFIAFLDCVMLDLDVIGTRGGTRFIDHKSQNSLVINVEFGRTRRTSTRYLFVGTKIGKALN